MCLYSSANQMMVPPTVKAAYIAQYLKGLLLALLVFSVLEFLCQRYIDGVFALVVLLIGVLALRSNEGYVFPQVFCLSFISGFQFILSVVESGIFFGAEADTIVGAVWQYWIQVVTEIAMPFVFVSICAVSYGLFGELKLVVNEMAAQLSEDGGGGGYYGGAAAPSASSAPVGGSAYVPPTARDSSLNGFRAFQGQGHRLGA